MPLGFDQSSELKRKKTWKERTSTIRIGKKTYPFIYPGIRDARVIQVAALTSYAILGQTIYTFQVNPLHILICVGTAAIIDLLMNFWLKKIVLFPVSGMIAGFGISMMLRIRPSPWSYAIYFGAAAVSVLSKYVFTTRWSGVKKHIFNPSNFGICLTFFLLPAITYPTPQQWDKTWWLMLYISCIGLVLARSAKVTTVVATFLLTEIALFVIHEGALLQGSLPYLLQNIVPALLSPALVIFSFHMLPDPRTIPEGQQMRIVFAMATAIMHWLFIALGYSVKSIYLALIVTSLFVPLMNRLTLPEAKPFAFLKGWKKAKKTEKTKPKERTRIVPRPA